MDSCSAEQCHVECTHDGSGVSRAGGEGKGGERGDVLSCKDNDWNKSATVPPYRGT